MGYDLTQLFQNTESSNCQPSQTFTIQTAIIHTAVWYPVSSTLTLYQSFTMPVRHSCPVCFIYILHEDKSIQCDDACERWFHHDCVKLSNTEYSRLMNPRTNDKSKWTCRRCDCVKEAGPSLPQGDNQTLILNSLLKKFESLASKEDIQAISSDIGELRKEISSLTAKINSIEPRLASVEGDINKLKSDVSNIQSNCSSINSQSTDDLFSEFTDRNLRQANIILHQVPETTTPSSTNSDQVSINAIFDTIGFRPHAFSFFRLGRRAQPSNTRPLKIVFSSPNLTKEFFKSFTVDKLTNTPFAGVTASRDRTPQERKLLQDLRTQLDTLEKGGEKDLTIKYVNGVPKIIKKSKN